MPKPRLVVFGYSDVGHACLKFLIEKKSNIAVVFTHEDNLNEPQWFPSVAALAREHSIPIHTADLSVPAEKTFLESLKPELIFSFYYRNMIPSWALALPTLGAYNMHGSLLPNFRGRAPINWAVIKGATEAGPTLHVMVEKPDAGDIVDQQSDPIGPDDTAAMVQARLTKAAVKILERQIGALEAGTAKRRPQDLTKGSYFGRRRPEDGRIDWNWPAQQVHNLIRGVSHPYPGAFGDISGQKVVIWASVMAPIIKGLKPGESKMVGNKFFIGCGENSAIEVLRVQRDGELEVSAVDFEKRRNKI